MKAFFYKTFFKLIGLIPIEIRSILGLIIGTIFSFIPTKDRKVAKLQLQLAFPREARPSIASVYASLGQSLFESFNLRPMCQNLNKHFFSDEFELIDKLMNSDHPLVALTAHSGNWDFLGAAMVKRGAELSTIGKKNQNKDLQILLEKIRSSYGIKTIWRGSSKSSKETKEIVEVLKNNQVLAALIDQDTKVTSDYLPFFFLNAKTPTGLIALSKRYNSKIIVALSARIGFLKYKLFVEEIDSSIEISEISKKYNQILEKFIRKYPNQWAWIHKRWRTRENGVRLSSNEYIKFLQKHLQESKATNPTN